MGAGGRRVVAAALAAQETAARSGTLRSQCSRFTAPQGCLRALERWSAWAGVAVREQEGWSVLQKLATAYRSVLRDTAPSAGPRWLPKGREAADVRACALLANLPEPTLMDISVQGPYQSLGSGHAR